MIPFSLENMRKCLCGKCPVQARSSCAAQLAAALEQAGPLAAPPAPEAVPGLYCASGAASCPDLDLQEMCACGDCPLFDEYRLHQARPLGYYCRDGKAQV
ncbi:MAG: DUF2769 domain-containing protein [Syntrophomonadaceae bacterium]|nr:DUF2769 domain-containing protein [Syntrophomonadaceae bacterium]MDH7498481.1 DUF2769 domain-containing protein [Syntrophomonadaceae bacterium]